MFSHKKLQFKNHFTLYYINVTNLKAARARITEAEHFVSVLLQTHFFIPCRNDLAETIFLKRTRHSMY